MSGIAIEQRHEYLKFPFYSSKLASAAKIRTTSFGGTSPDVSRENVVRFETEGVSEGTARKTHLGGW